MTRVGAAVLIAVGLLVGLTGCGLPSGPAATAPTAAPAAPADPLPPRPREIRMDGLDPCALASPEVLKQAGVPDKPQVVPAKVPGVRDCSWDRSILERPSGSLGVTTATNQDVRNVLYVKGAQVTTVAGFGAVEIPIAEYGEQFNCDVRIDVAPNQGLWVGYVSILADEQGATHELMCQRARTAAEGIMRSLLASTK